MTDKQILEAVDQAMELGRQQGKAEGRAELAIELLAIKDPCDDCYIDMCESCSHRFDYSIAIQEKLEQIKEQRNDG